ncbi:MAG: hypothetical protein GY711_04580 [bacterium]|nr:hypothetical protein [bacterium]
MRLFHLLPPVVLFALPAGDDFVFRVAAGGALRGELASEYRWTFESIIVEWDGQEFDVASYNPALELGGKRSAVWTDEWESVEGGAPTRYTRRFEKIANEDDWKWLYGTNNGTETARLACSLVGEEFRVQHGSDGAGWNVEPLDERGLKERDWAGLAGAVGWSGLRPEEPASVGEHWYIDGSALREMLQPVGRPGVGFDRFDGEFDDLFLLLTRLLDTGELLQWNDEAITASYVDQDDGVAELELEACGSERLDLIQRALETAAQLEIDERTVDWLEEVVLDVRVKAEGSALWSTAKSRPCAAEVAGTAEAELLLVLSVAGSMRIRVGLEGEFRSKLAFTEPRE